MERRRLAVLGLLLTAYSVLAILTAATRHPTVNEAWFASPALTLLDRGYLGTTILEGRGTWLEGMDRHTYWVPPLHLLFQAAWYKLFGFGLMSLRSISIAWGAVMLVAWYSIVAKLSGNRGIALLAVGVAGTDARFLAFAAQGRMDTMCAGLGFLSLAAYLHFRVRSVRQATLIAHALAAASCLTHFWGALYFAGLIGLMVALDRRRIGRCEVALVVLPYALALSAWGIYALQSPATFLAQLTGNVSGVSLEYRGASRWSGLASPLLALRREYVVRYAANFGRHGSSFAERIPLAALLAYTLAVVVCLAKRSIRDHPGYRLLLLFGAFEFLTMAFSDGLKNSSYLVHTLPVCAGLLAISVQHGSSGVTVPALRRISSGLVIAAMAVFSVVQVAYVVYSLRHQRQRWDYEATVSFLRRQPATSSRLIGCGSLAFALGFDSGMVDDYRLGYYSGRRPEFIVSDKMYQAFLERSAATSPDVHRYMVRQLEDNYRLVFWNASYRVYRRNPK